MSKTKAKAGRKSVEATCDRTVTEFTTAHAVTSAPSRMLRVENTVGRNVTRFRGRHES